MGDTSWVADKYRMNVHRMLKYDVMLIWHKSSCEPYTTPIQSKILSAESHSTFQESSGVRDIYSGFDAKVKLKSTERAMCARWYNISCYKLDLRMCVLSSKYQVQRPPWFFFVKDLILMHCATSGLLSMRLLKGMTMLKMEKKNLSSGEGSVSSRFAM